MTYGTPVSWHDFPDTPGKRILEEILNIPRPDFTQLDKDVAAYEKKRSDERKSREQTIDISKDFTIEDIHKIREYNWEHTKNLPASEQAVYYKSKAESFLAGAGIKPLSKNKNVQMVM